MNRKIMLSLFLFWAETACFAQLPYGKVAQIDTIAQKSVNNAAIAGLPDGGFVVCCLLFNNSSTDNVTDIYWQRYDPEGKRIDEFTFQLSSVFYPYSPTLKVAGLQNGGFVICWSSAWIESSVVYFQLFDFKGTKKGEITRASAAIGIRQSSSGVAGLPDGGFVICWESFGWHETDSGIYAQRFDAEGKKLGNEFRAHSQVEYWQRDPVVISLNSGNFIVSWVSDIQNGRSVGIFYQLYATDGRTIGNEAKVGEMEGPYVSFWYTAAPLVGGGFLFCWLEQDWGRVTFLLKIRIYDGNGKAQSEAMQVKTRSKYQVMYPTAANLHSGGFVINWFINDYESGRTTGSWGQLFNEQAAPSTPPFRHSPQSIDFSGVVSALANDGFIFCYRANNHWYIVCYPDTPQRHELRPFALLQPRYDATIKTTVQTLQWQPASEPAIVYPFELNYTVEYDTLPDFSTGKTRRADNDTSLTLYQLRPGKTVFWRVLAKTYECDSLWSSDGAFFVSLNADTSGNSLDPGEDKETDDQDDEPDPPPASFVLYQNAPNPFNLWTRIVIDLPTEGKVRLIIYDIRGRRVRRILNGAYSAGQYFEWWDGTDDTGLPLASGVYFYRAEYVDASGKTCVQTNKMSLVK